MTKLLISLPLSDEAQKYYGSAAPKYNKVGDAGIDLPFISNAQPYDCQLAQTLMRLDFGTVFAMYHLSTLSYHNLDGFFANNSLLPFSSDAFNNLKIISTHYTKSHFDIRPRSSIDKTPFRLANSVGTIDKFYRGVTQDTDKWTGDTLKASLDYHPLLGATTYDSYIFAGDRLLQIVAPHLDDIIHVRLDFTEENCVFWSETISDKKRDGFGSTNV